MGSHLSAFRISSGKTRHLRWRRGIDRLIVRGVVNEYVVSELKLKILERWYWIHNGWAKECRNRHRAEVKRKVGVTMRRPIIKGGWSIATTHKVGCRRDEGKSGIKGDDITILFRGRLIIILRECWRGISAVKKVIFGDSVGVDKILVIVERGRSLEHLAKTSVEITFLVLIEVGTLFICRASQRDGVVVVGYRGTESSVAVPPLLGTSLKKHVATANILGLAARSEVAKAEVESGVEVACDMGKRRIMLWFDALGPVLGVVRVEVRMGRRRNWVFLEEIVSMALGVLLRFATGFVTAFLDSRFVVMRWISRRGAIVLHLR
jgi:hypothetical protein